MTICKHIRNLLVPFLGLSVAIGVLWPFASAWAMLNPSAVYCRALGYEYLVVNTRQGEVGMCKLPDGDVVNGWDFLIGEVGLEWSYCAQKDYEAKVRRHSTFCGDCSSCVLPSGEEVEVTQLMGLSFDETICGDGNCGTSENHSTCPADCASGDVDDFCDGLADGICDPDCREEGLPDPDCADSDSDGVLDLVDNCPTTPNPNQADTNGDGVGNACSCPVVTDLAARAKSTNVYLTWSNVDANAYNIYRSLAAGGPFTLAAAGHISDYSMYLDNGASIGTTYYYAVNGVCNGVEGQRSNEVSVTPADRSIRRRR